MSLLFFYHTDLGQKAVFHSFARKIALIQNSGRSKHALFLHNKYRIDQVHEENSIISGLFNQNNLLLCGMQGNDGLLAKKKFQNHLHTASRFSRLTSADEFELNCIYSRSEARFQSNNTPISLRLHRILQIP